MKIIRKVKKYKVKKRGKRKRKMVAKGLISCSLIFGNPLYGLAVDNTDSQIIVAKDSSVTVLPTTVNFSSAIFPSTRLAEPVLQVPDVLKTPLPSSKNNGRHLHQIGRGWSGTRRIPADPLQLSLQYRSSRRESIEPREVYNTNLLQQPQLLRAPLTIQGRVYNEAQQIVDVVPLLGDFRIDDRRIATLKQLYGKQLIRPGFEDPAYYTITEPVFMGGGEVANYGERPIGTGPPTERRRLVFVSKEAIEKDPLKNLKQQLTFSYSQLTTHALKIKQFRYLWDDYLTKDEQSLISKGNSCLFYSREGVCISGKFFSRFALDPRTEINETIHLSRQRTDGRANPLIRVYYQCHQQDGRPIYYAIAAHKNLRCWNPFQDTFISAQRYDKTEWNKLLASGGGWLRSSTNLEFYDKSNPFIEQIYKSNEEYAAEFELGKKQVKTELRRNLDVE